MLKSHLITVFVKIYANFKKIFLIWGFWLYIFPIQFQILTLDKMLLPKTVSHLKGYTTLVFLNHRLK